MSIYSTIYYNLCSKNVSKKEQWNLPHSNLHRHHINPRHSGGEDIESNFTYLTVREHKIAHYLLWKINNTVNDLRAMHMLGANLTSQQRSIVGKWCADNGIGFHNPDYDDIRNDWRKRGCVTQIKNKIGIHDPDNFSKHASLGGKASAKSPNHFGFESYDKDVLKELCSKAAKKLTGRKTMYLPGTNEYKRVKSENIDAYLAEGYIMGMGPKAWNARRASSES